MPKPVIALICLLLFSAPIGLAVCGSLGGASLGSLVSNDGTTDSNSEVDSEAADEKPVASSDEKSGKALIYFYDDT